MSAFLDSPIFAIALTVGVYWLAHECQRRTKIVILNPILIAMLIIIALLKISNVSYASYHSGGQYLEFLLKPAIVALGVPLYLQLEQIKKQALPVIVSQCVACVTGVLTVVLVAHWLGGSVPVIMSLSPKSATTPIAIEVSRMVGGIPALSAIIVILTGIFGAAFGMTILRLLAIKRPMAQGLAMGAAAHAVGTAQAMQRNRKLGAYSSIGLILNGTLTGLLTPYLLQLLGY
ncbi:MAG: LrgB family protein [Oxalobacter sp.]|nr:MAG: LrgB family protein [Oxalobacter sp.]